MLWVAKGWCGLGELLSQMSVMWICVIPLPFRDCYVKDNSSFRKEFTGSAGGSPEGRSHAEFISRSATCQGKAPTGHKPKKRRFSGAAGGGCQPELCSCARGSSMPGCWFGCPWGLASFPIWVPSSFRCLSSRRRLAKLRLKCCTMNTQVLLPTVKLFLDHL